MVEPSPARVRSGNPRDNSGIVWRRAALLVCGLLAGLPAGAQVHDQAAWDAAYDQGYGGVDPYLDGPWSDLDQPDPDGVFGDTFAWNAHSPFMN